MTMGSFASTFRMHSAPLSIRFPGSVSSWTGALAHFPWLVAFPPASPSLAGRSRHSSVLCHHPTASHRSSAAPVLGLPAAARVPPSLSSRAVSGSPDSRTECFQACVGSPTAPCPPFARATAEVMWPTPTLTGSAHGSIPFSWLNTQPAGSPTNASRAELLPPAHGSGPIWFARPLLFETFTLFTLRRFSSAHLGWVEGALGRIPDQEPDPTQPAPCPKPTIQSIG
jgi:hypothetical protein